MAKKNNAFLAKLKKAQKFWDSAKEQASEGFQGSSVEDGRYLAKLVGASLGESQASGRLQVAWKFKILEGEFKGETVMNFCGVETEENLKFLARDIARFGYELPEDLVEELETMLAEIQKEGAKCRITVKTNGEYQNVYLNKVVTGAQAEEDGAEGGEGPEEEGEEPESEEAESVPEEPEAEPEAEAEAEPEAEEEAEPESEEVEVTEGAKVSFKVKGKEVEGTVIEILEKENKLRVETEEGLKYRLGADQVELLPELKKAKVSKQTSTLPKKKAKK